MNQPPQKDKELYDDGKARGLDDFTAPTAIWGNL
jgi:hypothetical protein